MALLFILEIDDLLYKVLAPKHAMKYLSSIREFEVGHRQPASILYNSQACVVILFFASAEPGDECPGRLGQAWTCQACSSSQRCSQLLPFSFDVLVSAGSSQGCSTFLVLDPAHPLRHRLGECPSGEGGQRAPVRRQPEPQTAGEACKGSKKCDAGLQGRVTMALKSSSR